MQLKKIGFGLGSLENEIMEVVWRLESATVRDVLSQLKRKVAYTTVMTVMSRLADKGILRRKLKEGAYIYVPKQDRASFLAQASEQAIKNLIYNYGEVAVAQFFDIVEKGEAKELREWQKKLKKIK